MFTLAHELAHLWLGQSALTDATAASVARGPTRGGADVERWCNAVAAEMLVPMESFRIVYRPGQPLNEEKQRLALHYKVSTLVVLRRMFDAGGLSRDDFQTAFKAEVAHLRQIMARKKDAGGGDFYATARVRLSPRFARAVLAATWEGRSTFTEAFRMLGCKNVKTLENLGERLGMADYMRSGAL
jgi:Zn-dependent peptidase ImmA (M78 family)